MKGYLKIPREWLTDWKLTGNECVLLADILDWNTNNQDERAFRVNMTTRGVRKVLKRLEEQEQSSSLIKAKRDNKEEQSSHKRGTKFLLKEEQSSLPPTPPYIEEQKEKQEEHLSPTTSVGVEENSPKKRENKYTPEQQKFHGELRDIYLEEWKRYNNDDFNWSPAAMANTIKVIGQIKFKMEKEGLTEITNDKLKDNFRIFIQQMFKNLPWYRQNGTPQIIYSKFNEIYIQLKNGKSSSNSADNFHVFGSRNITPDILAEFA